MRTLRSIRRRPAGRIPTDCFRETALRPRHLTGLGRTTAQPIGPPRTVGCRRDCALLPTCVAKRKLARKMPRLRLGWPAGPARRAFCRAGAVGPRAWTVSGAAGAMDPAGVAFCEAEEAGA